MLYYIFYDCPIMENPQLIPAFCLVTCEWTKNNGMYSSHQSSWSASDQAASVLVPIVAGTGSMRKGSFPGRRKKGRRGNIRDEKQNKEGEMRKNITESNVYCSLRLMIAHPQALYNLR